METAQAEAIIFYPAFGQANNEISLCAKNAY